MIDSALGLLAANGLSDLPAAEKAERLLRELEYLEWDAEASSAELLEDEALIRAHLRLAGEHEAAALFAESRRVWRTRPDALDPTKAAREAMRRRSVAREAWREWRDAHPDVYRRVMRDANRAQQRAAVVTVAGARFPLGTRKRKREEAKRFRAELREAFIAGTIDRAAQVRQWEHRRKSRAARAADARASRGSDTAEERTPAAPPRS